MSNPTELYLPLLNHPDPEVRRQSATLLLATYGEHGLTYLRRLLDSETPAIQNAARSALLTVADTSGIHVELRPFRGVYVRCLGDLRVFINSYELQSGDWGNEDTGRAGGRKVQGLFAFLVHRAHQGATRNEIAEAVWGTQVSAVSISRTLGALRQVLTRYGSPDVTAELLITNRERVALNPGSYMCDADHFERTFELACQREDQEGLGSAQPLYHQVLSLYAGPYMAGFDRGSDWGQSRRDLLASSYVIAAERLAQHAYEHRSDRQCLNMSRQGLMVDPSDDDLTIWMLRAYARQDLWVDLERAYQAYLAAAEISAESRDHPVYAAYAQLRPSDE